MLRVVLTFSLFFASSCSFALTPFEKHLVSVTQGMSAFYMYLLSDKDKKFKSHYEAHFTAATAAINEVKEPEQQVLTERWNKLEPTLKYEEVDDMGLSLNENIRQEFRSYVADLYLEYMLAEKDEKYAISAYERIQVYSSFLAARALDVDSTIYNYSLFTEKDYQLDQVQISQVIDSDLNALLDSDLPNSYKIQLRRLKAKFKFMKSSLTDYDTASASFLLYQNALSVNKILTEQQANPSVIAKSLL